METVSRTITQTIKRIRITWERDDDVDITHLNEQAAWDMNWVMRTETIAKLQSEGGCTLEQAIEQTDALIKRVVAWRDDMWNYVGCVAYALAEDGHQVASCSVWGIESFCGDYALEVEKEQVAELRAELKKLGFSFTGDSVASDEVFNAIPISVLDRPSDIDPGAIVGQSA